MAGGAGVVRFLLLLGLLSAAALSAGCGDDTDGGGEAASAQQLEQARREGAREARQRDRLESLQKRVKRLEGDGAAATVVVKESEPPRGDAAPGVIRAFHTPNVACEIRADSAICSVISIGLTFAMEGFGAAHTESGIRVSEGTGSEAAWDSTVGAGAITCRIPAEDEPRGITCTNSASGHGFEASRVPDRQQVY